MRSRLLLAASLLSLALAIAGCGGSGSSSELARFAPPGSLVFVEGKVRPSGELKSNVDAIAKKVAGVDNLGDLIVSKLESKAREEGEAIDYAKEIEPWLGERAALFATNLNGGNPARSGVVVQATDPAAARKFIDHLAKVSRHRVGGGSYKGVEYKVDYEGTNVTGVVDGALVVGDADSTAAAVEAFEEVVDASRGESLADVDRFDRAMSAAPSGSLLDAYTDIGGLLRQSSSEGSRQFLQGLRTAGVDTGEITVLASLVPGPDQVEVDISLSSNEARGGDASKLLTSLPADSFAALAIPDFGDSVEKLVDRIDASGFPGQIPPHMLKRALKEKGIDLEAILGSLHDAAVFGIGSDRRSLGGAVLFTTDDPTRARNTVSNIGLLLSASGTPGVTPLSDGTGFSIRSPGLGSKPLVIAAEGDRIVIAYGLPVDLASDNRTLADTPDFKAAVASLGGTPIGAFVDGPATLRLVDSLVPASETGFEEAKPYLANIRFLAFGAAGGGDRSTAKLIVGLTK